MRKILILLVLFSSFASGKVWAQCYGYNCSYNYGFSGYSYGYGYYNPYLPKSYQVAYGIYQFFGTLNEGLDALQQGRALENEIQVRRNALENYKSVKRFYTEGIPAFSQVAPNGQPRSSKITWEDVESIRWNEPLRNSEPQANQPAGKDSPSQIGTKLKKE